MSTTAPIYTNAPLTFADYGEHLAFLNDQQFGEAGAYRTAQDLALLEATFAKALSSTGITPTPGVSGGDALKDHTVAAELAITERRKETEAPMWTRYKKVPHPYDRVEFRRIDDFGGDEYGSVLNTRTLDGGLQPTEPNTGVVVLPMAWYGVLGVVTLMLNTQRTVGFNGIAVGNAQDTLGITNLNNLVLNMDRHTVWGKHSVNPFQPDGLIEQTRRANTKRRPTRINLRGQTLTRHLAQHIEAILREKGAMWSEMWMTGYSRADFTEQFADAVRVATGNTLTANNRIEDVLISKWNGAEGQAKILTQNHLRPRAWNEAASPGAPSAPVTITLTQFANPLGNAWSEDGNIENLPAGPITYFVRARGINGVSVPVSAGTINVVAGNAVNIAITKNDLGAIEYEIFAVRNASGIGAKFLGRVGAFVLPNGNTINVGAVVNFVDDGEYVPGCDTALILANGALPNGEDEVQFKQQFPVTKVPLPRHLLGFPTAYVAAMTPQDQTPGYNLILENMGRTALVA